jgi:hypothetical protein
MPEHMSDQPEGKGLKVGLSGFHVAARPDERKDGYRERRVKAVRPFSTTTGRKRHLRSSTLRLLLSCFRGASGRENPDVSDEAPGGVSV